MENNNYYIMRLQVLKWDYMGLNFGFFIYQLSDFGLRLIFFYLVFLDVKWIRVLSCFEEFNKLNDVCV